MKNVILIAPVLTRSGYGEHARQVVQYLFDKLDNGAQFNLDIWPISCGNSPYFVDRKNPLIDRIYRHCNRTQATYDVSIQVQLSTTKEWNPAIANVNIGITAGIETDLCNKDFVNTVNAMDLVIVPSKFSTIAYTNGFRFHNVEQKTKIEVVNEFISDTYLNLAKNDTKKEIDFGFETKFNFLVFGQLTSLDKDTDRKNLFTSLQTLFAAFQDNPEVGIIVKTNMGRETALDRKHVTNILEQIKEHVCPMINGQAKQPKLYSLHGMMSEEELYALYTHKTVKALYTATRGEAVGLPIVEAAACGLPVLATQYGGHTEYLQNDKWIKLAAKKEKINPKRVDELFHSESSWYEVEPYQAVESLKRFYKQNSTPKQWAIQQKKYIAQNFNKQKIFEQYEKVLGEYL